MNAFLCVYGENGIEDFVFSYHTLACARSGILLHTALRASKDDKIPSLRGFRAFPCIYHARSSPFGASSFPRATLPLFLSASALAPGLVGEQSRHSRSSRLPSHGQGTETPGIPSEDLTIDFLGLDVPLTSARETVLKPRGGFLAHAAGSRPWPLPRSYCSVLGLGPGRRRGFCVTPG